MKPKLTVLVGPPCSGKSTLAGNMIRDSGGNGVLTTEYVNQDSQGKKEHLNIFHEIIKSGRDVIVDRMGFDKFQRARYINPAKEAGYETEIIVLHESKDTCFKRGMKRLVT